MGSYVPSGKSQRNRRAGTVSHALLEAERDHLLDCPNAEAPLRAAAFFCDLVLCTILWKGLGALSSAFGTYLLGTFPADGFDWRQASEFLAYVLKATMLYMYFVWCSVRHGGSPGKLLLGLRVIDATSGDWLTLPRVLLREVIAKPVGAAVIAGFVMPLLRPDSRSVHDLLAESVVKRVHWIPTDGERG